MSRDGVPATSIHREGGLWVATVDRDPAPLTGPQLEQLLGPDVARASTLSGRRRELFVAGRQMARQLAISLDDSPWRGFSPSTSRTRPSFEARDAAFSVSYSGDTVAVFVGEAPAVGVDIEACDRDLDLRGLVRQACSDSERDELDTLPASGRRAFLLDVVTVKEAYSKARGVGLALRFRDVTAAGIRSDPEVRVSHAVETQRLIFRALKLPIKARSPH